MSEGENAPVTVLLEELKQWLRIEDGGQDALLYQLLHAATEAVEAQLGGLLIVREVEESGWLCDGRLRLAARPVRELVSAVVIDGEEEAEFADSRLDRRGDGSAVVLFPGMREGLVRVRFRAGGVADWNGVSEAVRLAVMRLAAHFHVHRDGDDDRGIPATVMQMLAPHRVRRLA